MSTDVNYRFSIPPEGDAEGLFMSNYEVVADYLGRRLSTAGCKSALDICCGIGATSIFVARNLDFVYGIDINPERIIYAKKNAERYGVSDKTDFVVGDALNERLIKSFNVDAVITDVDWARPGDDKGVHTTSLSETQPPMDLLYQLILKHLSENIAMRLSPMTNLEEVQKLAHPCETEKIFIERPGREFHLSFYYVYTGRLRKCEGFSEKRFSITA